MAPRACRHRARLCRQQGPAGHPFHRPGGHRGRPDRPQRRRQDVAVQLHHRLLQAAGGPHRLRRPRAAQAEAAQGDQGRDRPHLPEPQAVPGDDGSRERHVGDALPQPRGCHGGGAAPAFAARRGTGDRGLLQGLPAVRRDRRRRARPGSDDAGLRPSAARRDRPGAGDEAQAAAARRAGGRPQCRREAGAGRAGRAHP